MQQGEKPGEIGGLACGVTQADCRNYCNEIGVISNLSQSYVYKKNNYG